MTDKYEKALESYFNKHSEYEFLDLELPKPELKQAGNIEHNCFQKGHKHKVYTDNEQLNFLSDCSLTLINNHSQCYRQINLGSKVNLKHFYSIQEELSVLHRKIDSLESTQKQILSIVPGENLSGSIKELLTKSEAQKLIQQVLDHPKTVEEEAIRLTENLSLKLKQVEAVLAATQKIISEVSQHLL